MPPPRLPAGVTEFGDRLRPLGWVVALRVGGSAATGDHRAAVSDVDLVAVTEGPIDDQRRKRVTGVAPGLDAGAARGLNLGCSYVDAARAADVHGVHPTWTHGELVQRVVSGISRAELIRYGWAVYGPSASAVLAAVTNDDVRRHGREQRQRGRRAVAVHARRNCAVATGASRPRPPLTAAHNDCDSTDRD